MDTQILKELVSQEVVERAFLTIAVAGLAVGLITGIAIGTMKHRSKQYAAAGFLLGLLFCGVYGMWLLFDAITDKLGLDSIANLGAQLLLFSAIGAVAGLAVAHLVVMLSRNA